MAMNSAKGLEARTNRTMMAIVAICGLAYLLDGVVHTVLGPLAPQIAQELHLSNAQLGPIFSANLIGQCFGLVLFPIIAGRTGHRPMVIATLFGFGIFQTLSCLAQDGQQLFWLRLFTGFFLGGALPSSLAIVTAAAPVERRGLIISGLFVGYGIGCALAGLVSFLFVFGGWRGATALIGGVCILAALVAWRGLREPPGVYIPLARAPGVASPRAVLALLQSQYLVGTLMLWFLFISMLTISYCLNSWLPILLVQAGRGASFASLSVTIFGLGGIIAGMVVGALMDRFGATRVLAICFVCATALMFWIGQILATGSLVLLTILLTSCGCFALGSYAGINVVLATFYSDELRALGIGVTKSVGRIGTVLAPILIGFALTAGMPGTTVVSLFAVPTALCAVALLVIAAARAKA